MKQTKLILITSLFASFVLTSCSFFENINETGKSGGENQPSQPSQTSTIEYTANDILYYKKAGEEICSLKSGNTSKSFYKAYDGYCAVALANIGKYFGPVLVGEDPVQVSFYSGSNSTIVGSAGSIEYNGKTYFYSKDEQFLSGSLDGKTKYTNYFSTFTSLEEVALDLVSKATFTPVEESAKTYFIYNELDVGTYQVSAGPYAKTIKDLIIPAQYNNVDVTKIKDEGFKGLDNLESIRFESGSKISSIGRYAFQDCKSIKYAVIPSTITSVGYRAFYNVNASLLVFNGVESSSGYDSNWFGGQEERAFWGYTNYLVSDDFIYGVNLDGNLAVVRYISEKTEIAIPDTYDNKAVVCVEKYAFNNQNTLLNVTLPSGLKRINNYAFSGCTRLEKIDIPYGTVSIGRYAFQDCKSMTYAILPATLTTCAYRAFYNCTALTIYSKDTFQPSSFDSNWKPTSVKAYWATEWYLDSDGVPHPNN